MQNSDMAPNPEEMAKWEAEFNELMNKQREEGGWDYSTGMQNVWEGGVPQLDDTFTHNLTFDQDGIPILDPYVFGLFPLLLDDLPLLTERREKQQIPRPVIFHPVATGPSQTNARAKRITF